MSGVSDENIRPRAYRTIITVVTRPIVLITLAVLTVLSCADDALAWGPAMHVGLADSVWSQLGLLPAGVAAVLARHRIPFLYGSIAADVVVAKRLSRVKQFCHHWSTAFRVLDSADDERSKAFAYGYLSHLAADTVAHSKFVPRQIVVTDGPVNAGHLYWELRADAACPAAAHSLVKQVLYAEHADHHALLSRHLTGTFLPYDLNRKLFHRMNVLAVNPTVRRGISAWGRRSRWPLSSELLGGYQTECVDRILAVLTDGHRSALTKEDPNGTSALMRLSVRRKETRRLKRRGGGCLLHKTEAVSGLAPAAWKVDHATPSDVGSLHV